MQYLYLSARASFPCTFHELQYALKRISRHPERYLDKWPSHGHGEEWRMDREYSQSVMVLDLHNKGAILSMEDLKKIQAWPEPDTILVRGNGCSTGCPFYGQGFGNASCYLEGDESLVAGSYHYTRTTTCRKETVFIREE
jgi:hypothetical protein